MELELLRQITEAILFASESPVPIVRIKSVVAEATDDAIRGAIALLNEEYKKEGRCFEIRKVAGGYQLVTRQHFSKWIRKFKKGQTRQRLSHAALEALSIIAVKQPVSRTEIAAIRGVHSDGVLKNLLERDLITMAGRAKTVGRPLLYATTEKFLTYFGIDDISELPTIEEIEQLLSAHEPEDRVIPESEESENVVAVEDLSAYKPEEHETK